MASPKLLKWIHDSPIEKWAETVKLWKRTASHLDQEDPILATLCRRMAGDVEKLTERIKAHLLDEQFCQEDRAQEDVETMIQQAFAKALGT